MARVKGVNLLNAGWKQKVPPRPIKFYVRIKCLMKDEITLRSYALWRELLHVSNILLLSWYSKFFWSLYIFFSDLFYFFSKTSLSKVQKNYVILNYLNLPTYKFCISKMILFTYSYEVLMYVVKGGTRVYFEGFRCV